MRIFLTKVCGWYVPVMPLHFSTEGWRKNTLEKLNPGDWVVLAGTSKEPTPENMRGRLLGIMEPSQELVDSSDFDMTGLPEHDFENGKYRWPFGLMNLRAWSLPRRPETKSICDQIFYLNSAVGIVPLTDDEAERVLKLERREEKLRRPVAQTGKRMA